MKWNTNIIIASGLKAHLYPRVNNGGGRQGRNKSGSTVSISWTWGWGVLRDKRRCIDGTRHINTTN